MEADRAVRAERMRSRGRRVRGYFLRKYGEGYELEWFAALEYNYEIGKRALQSVFTDLSHLR